MWRWTMLAHDGPFAEDYSTRTTAIVTLAMLASRKSSGAYHRAEDRLLAAGMEYARDRNIGSYIVTWNIYTYGVDGKYGITDAIDNPKTIDYFRASVREMFRAYPLLAGIGLTAGENMDDSADYSDVSTPRRQRELAAGNLRPGRAGRPACRPSRRFRLIHRQHEAPRRTSRPPSRDREPNVDFIFSFNTRKHMRSPRP